MACRVVRHATKYSIVGSRDTLDVNIVRCAIKSIPDQPPWGFMKQEASGKSCRE
jgi:hypothetical protein